MAGRMDTSGKPIEHDRLSAFEIMFKSACVCNVEHVIMNKDSLQKQSLCFFVQSFVRFLLVAWLPMVELVCFCQFTSVVN